MITSALRSFPRIAILLALPLFSLSNPAYAQTAPKYLAEKIAPLVPPGYHVQETRKISSTGDGGSQYLVALSEAPLLDRSPTSLLDSALEIPKNPPILMLLQIGTSAKQLDGVTLHGEGKTCLGPEPDLVPNYFHGLEAEELDGGKVYLAISTYSGGGSDGYFYFDLYKIDGEKLKLLASYPHDRLMRTYFTVFNHAIYDGKLSCSRGDKHGAAYTYTCGLNVTKYVYDGNSIQAAGTERLHERQGNRFLNEKYWMTSVRQALERKEIFANP